MPLNFLPAWGIRISSHRHEKTGAVKLHRHPFPSLVVVTDGKGGCWVGDREYALYPDSAIVIPANVDHETHDQPGHPMSVFSVEFATDKIGMSSRAWEALLERKSPIALPVYGAKGVQLQLRTLLHEQKNQIEEFDIAMQAALSRLMVILYRCHLQKNQHGHESFDSVSKVREVLKDLQENYHEQNALGDAARMAHLSQRQFSNLCHQLVGDSYVNWINNIRCQKAVELLTTSQMPIASIAFEVGFEELSTFYRAFKKHCGQAPGAFRGS